jgi:hypothetical protein
VYGRNFTQVVSRWVILLAGGGKANPAYLSSRTRRFLDVVTVPFPLCPFWLNVRGRLVPLFSGELGNSRPRTLSTIILSNPYSLGRPLA